MNPWRTTTATVLALFLPGLAQADLYRLQVQHQPEKSRYTKEETLRLTATGNGEGMQYQFQLERTWPTQLQVLTTEWSNSNTFEFDLAPVNVGMGRYRVRVAAREQARPRDSMMEYATFFVAEDRVVNPDLAQQKALLRARYDRAAAVLEDAFRRVKNRFMTGADVTAACADMRDAGVVIGRLLDPQNESAPGGGPAYTVTAGGDDATGAIGVVAAAGCEGAYDWSAVAFEISLPAWPAGNTEPLVAETRRVEFQNVGTEEEQDARRQKMMNMVRARYSDARNALLDVFAMAKDRLRVAPAYRIEFCNLFSDPDTLINHLLNEAQRQAPEGGNAYVAGRSRDDTGAIGVELPGSCEDPDVLQDIAVRLHRPAYPVGWQDGVTERVETLRFVP